MKGKMMKKLLVGVVVALIASICMAVPAAAGGPPMCEVPQSHVEYQFKRMTYETQERWEKYTQTRTRERVGPIWDRQWSEWSEYDELVDWPGVGPLDWGVVPDPMSGDHDGPEGDSPLNPDNYNDRRFEYVVVDTQQLETGYEYSLWVTEATMEGWELHDQRTVEDPPLEVPCPEPSVTPPACDTPGVVVAEDTEHYVAQVNSEDPAAVTVTFTSETATPSEFVFGPFDTVPIDCVDEFPGSPYWYWDDFCTEDGPYIGVFLANPWHEDVDENDVQADEVYIVDGTEYAVEAGSWEWVEIVLSEDDTREVVVTVDGEDFVLDYDADCQDPPPPPPAPEPAPPAPSPAPEPLPAITPVAASSSAESLPETGTSPWPVVTLAVMLLSIGFGLVDSVRRPVLA